MVGLRRWVSCHRPAGISRSGTSTVSAIDAKSTGGGVPCLAGRLHHSCRSFSHVCDTLAAAPRHLTLVAVPCLVSSVQFSACLVTSPTFVLFVLIRSVRQIETKNKLIAILVWRRTYQEAEDHRTKKLLRKSRVQSLQAPQDKPPCRFCIVPSLS